jgi:hypothetical protein
VQNTSHIFTNLKRFYYTAVIKSFSHQQLFRFKIYRHKQADTLTNFYYLKYWRQTESIISVKFHFNGLFGVAYFCGCLL